MHSKYKVDLWSLPKLKKPSNSPKSAIANIFPKFTKGKG